MTSKWERDVVTRITKSWVDMRCRWVTERDLGLLKLVDQFSMLTSKQLAILHPEFRHLRDPIHGLNRRLRKLWEHHILERAWFVVGYKEGTSPAVYAVDRAGAVLLEKQFQRTFLHDAKGKPVLPVQTRHKLGVNNIACELARVDMLSGWQSNFKALTMIADGFVDFPLFLEYDTGTEDRGSKNKFPTVMKKFEGYRRIFTAGWNHKGIFPAVIFATEDINRVEPLRKLIIGYPIQIFVIHVDKLPILLTRIKSTSEEDV